MEISIFGIGYVGAVAAACLARDGHEIVAVDLNQDKIDTIKSGRSPVVEPGLDRLIANAVASQRLRATSDVDEAVAVTNLSFVCVGTPSLGNGSLDTTHITRVSEQIGRAVGRKNDFHSIIVRSTIVPGTMERLVVPTLEASSGKEAGENFGIAYFPEFLREGSAISDYDQPGAIIFGIRDQASCDRLLEINSHFSVAPRIMSLRSAETIKYVNNAWHAVKIGFANEIGLICKAVNVDSFDVMEALCADTKLNISPAYLRPGFAFGGSCLPKDLRALRYRARMLDVETPILDAALTANNNQLDAAYQMIEQTSLRRVGLIGLSFKPGTDDLRYSPFVELAERLIGRGFSVKIYDPNIRLSNLTGSNRAYISERLPHIAELLLECGKDLVENSDIIVIGNRREARDVLELIECTDKTIIDLVRIDRSRLSNGRYQGLCW